MAKLRTAQRIARSIIGSVFLLIGSCNSHPGGGSQDLSTISPPDDAAIDSMSASYDCKSPPSDLKSCTSAADCGQVARGCYCGQQPVTGVALRYVSAAAACESQAAASCALGCANFPGRSADDGKTIADGMTASVSCETSGGMPGVCRTYVL